MHTPFPRHNFTDSNPSIGLRERWQELRHRRPRSETQCILSPGQALAGSGCPAHTIILLHHLSVETTSRLQAICCFFTSATAPRTELRIWSSRSRCCGVARRTGPALATRPTTAPVRLFDWYFGSSVTGFGR
eukprot:scaffold4614_cov247-Pinguiococcus_pyrenoidosus.AAC.12